MPRSVPRLLPALLLLPVLGGCLQTEASPAADSVKDHAAAAQVRIDGVRDGAVIGAADLDELTLRVVRQRGSAADVRVTLDGRPVQGQVQGQSLVISPTGLSDGEHTVTARIAGASSATPAPQQRSFTVDTTPPAVQLETPTVAGSLRGPVTVTGTARGASKVTVDGGTVQLHGDTFTATFANAPAGARLVAEDAAGNTTTQTVDVTVEHPMMRGVHMTPDAWGYRPLREPVLQMIRDKKINTVELDVKDEDGHLGYKSKVPLAVQIGATKDTTYDAAKVIAQLHGMGVRVVGRIVAFRDPTLASWAWRHGHHDWLVTDPSGKPWASSHYGAIAFTNVANAQVRQYNIDIATEAAKLGFDDIMYDYVRRPDGAISQMRFPGLKGSPEQAVAAFVRDTRGPVRAAGAFLGAAVFGVSATRPTEVAQDIPTLAKYVDYVSPMVYPSHWARGEYGVSNPNAQPYAIVQRSLKDFLAKVKGTDAQVMPWLQDFSLGVTYGDAQVQAQIKAAASDGIGSFLLWDAGCRYHAGALLRIG